MSTSCFGVLLFLAPIARPEFGACVVNLYLFLTGVSVILGGFEKFRAYRLREVNRWESPS